jgi:hypothetical protein
MRNGSVIHGMSPLVQFIKIITDAPYAVNHSNSGIFRHLFHGTPHLDGSESLSLFLPTKRPSFRMEFRVRDEGFDLINVRLRQAVAGGAHPRRI